MKMRMSTPHYLNQMTNKASPFGFVLHPRTRDDLKPTLLTSFSKDREKWAHTLCIKMDASIVRKHPCDRTSAEYSTEAPEELRSRSGRAAVYWAQRRPYKEICYARMDFASDRGDTRVGH